MLDTASLEAIALEARNCFLYEDAPEYIKMLTQGIAELGNHFGAGKSGQKLTDVYKDLGRAAHSIKGGAGMAEMQTVSKLAHKIEDIFEALEQNRVQDQQMALQLLGLGIEELENLIDAEVNGEKIADETTTDELITALDEFLQTVESASDSAEIGIANNDFVVTALTVDLDACLERVEEILQDPAHATPKNITESLKILEEECTLLGQALGCSWLVDISGEITQLRESNKLEITQLACIVIKEIKHLRDQFCSHQSSGELEYSTEFKQLLPEKKTVSQEEEKSAQIETKEESKVNTVNLRIPIQKVTRMSDTVGELLIYHERLLLYENQLKQASLNLKKRTQSLLPLKEQVQSLYDQLTITESEKINNNHHQNHSELEEFDSLEFDQYTQVHSTLQHLTELMVQVQEVREDVDLLSREFQETLITMRQSLDTLDQDLTQVRLVPFLSLAGSFINPVEKLNKKHNKSVQLVIEGEQVLIDQGIIEQLRTPFTHIIRNAFDHGIEQNKVRKKLGKPVEGKIKLSAKIEGNNVVISITDDGGGIDIDKVYQKAKNLGLFPSNVSREQLSDEQILEFIFSPGFSTAKKVSDLSGRGMGMDIVKAEIEKLRGTVQVKTVKDKGTQFKLKIPLAVNIISLLLVRCQQKKIAIPSENVLRIIRFSDYKIQENKLLWDEELIPIYPLFKLIPYQTLSIFDYSLDAPSPNIGLLLNVSGQKIFVAVDGIADERELVCKGFDDLVPVPAYIAGCTVLGSGEVVSILVPDYLKQLLTTLELQENEPKPQIQSETKKLSDQPSILVIDDSIAVRRTLNRILTQSGYQVVQCRDGKEAWSVLQTTNEYFNLAICDLEMPGFDGYKVLQLIRGSETWQNLPVIILTSRESELHRQKAMDLGANAYLTKPFHPVNILQTIDNYIIKD
jgi:type IV pili sensor histidine kinase/response regulator